MFLRLMVIMMFLVAFAIVYVLYLKPMLRKIPTFATLYDRLDVIESMLWQRSRTILLARATWLMALLVAVHDGIIQLVGGLDWTPISNRLLSNIPDDLRPVVIAGGIALLGVIFEQMRRISTGPVAGKE